MNKIVKRILLLISLLVALLVSVALISNLFCKAASFDERRLGYYQNEPENSIDVVFIGASEIYAGWAPALAYKEYGFTSYPYCISAAPVTLWKPMVQEALKKQKPKLIVVDPYGAVYDDNDGNFGLDNPAPKYQFLNMTPLSEDKIKMVNELCPNMSTMDKLSYLFPFVKHHDNYVDFIENFKASSEIRHGKTSPIKGMRTLTETYNPPTDTFDMNQTGTHPIVPVAEVALKDFLRYCRNEKINVKFIHFPVAIVEDPDYSLINRMCNYAGKIAETYGYEYINLQDRVNEIGLSKTEDFYQPGHLNVKGQRKTTIYIGKYLNEKCLKKHIKNKNADKGDWNKAYKTFEMYYKYSCDNMEKGNCEYLDDGRETIDKIEKGE